MDFFVVVVVASTSIFGVSGLDFQGDALKTSDIILLFTTSEAKQRFSCSSHAVDYSYRLC